MEKENLSALQTYTYTHNVRWICLCGLLMAINVLFSSFSIPVPGGHFYLNDMVIIVASVLLDPVGAAIVGGLGCFLGDFFFYPAPMFVSLVIHTLQGFVISYCTRKLFAGNAKKGAIIGSILGALIIIAGYTFGKIFVYSTYQYAMLKLPYEISQGITNCILGYILCWKLSLAKTGFGIISRQ